MYQLSLEGEQPTNLKEIMGWFAHIPDDINLSWVRQFTLEPLGPHYAGKVVHAPRGVYEIYQDTDNKPLNCKLVSSVIGLLFNGVLVWSRPDLTLRVPEEQRLRFERVMGSSEVWLAVYGDADGDPRLWQYHVYRQRTIPPGGQGNLPYLGTMDSDGSIK